MSTAPKFGKRGAEAVKVSGSFSGNTTFFQVPDGEYRILRFLTDSDAWPQFLQHQNIPTKAKPEGFKGNWPSAMPAPCRRDSQFADVYDNCYICDVLSASIDHYKKPGQRYWALACLREEVKEDGKVVGYKDSTVDVTRKDDKGEDVTTTEKAIVVLNMGWKNFFSILDGYGAAGGYGTVLDRDYKIIRKGEKLDTTYTILPLAEIPGLDLRNPEVMVAYLPKAGELGSEGASDDRLAEIIGERASDEFYGTFFDARVTVKQENATATSTAGPTPAQETPETVDPSPEAVADLVGRIRNYSPPKADAPAEEQVPVGAGAMRNFS
jgi:hypothetical protein